MSTGTDTKKASADFYTFFQRETLEIRDQIESLSNTGPNWQGQVEALLQRLRSLEVSFNQASLYIPPYDQKMYLQGMKSLNEALTLRQQALKPRSKFSFKSRDKKPVQEKVQEQKQEEKREELASSVSQNGATIRGFQKQRFRLEQPTTGTDTALDVLIDHCEDCIIDLTDGALTIAALHLSKLRRCLILCRPIQGSALIEDCQHCTFFFACHQFRMHTSLHVDCFLYISSHPIIEDCDAIRFGEYGSSLFGDKTTQLIHDVGLTGENQFDQVDDFNWLKAQHSPHWSLHSKAASFDAAADDIQTLLKEMLP